MKPLPRCLLRVFVALALAAGACSSQADSGDDGGAVGGGGAGSGGAGSGGAGSGGKSGSGGLQGSGGKAGSGGRQGSGGALGSGGATGGASGSGGADVVPSTGCGKTSTLKNNTSTTTFDYNKITSGGASRQYLLRLPATYDNFHPYRLILGFHGATGNATHVAGASYFNLVSLSQNSTIFVAPEASGGFWNATKDTTLVDDVLAQVEAELCIDKSRVELEGFSQGGAMAYTLVCARPGVFRAAVAHSPGGLALPQKCDAVAYFTSLGQRENNRGQTMTADFFAGAAGCTVETLPKAPTGGHVCSDYKNCSAGHPVRWCPFDGDHTDSPKDAGQSKSWMPNEVWTWLSQF